MRILKFKIILIINIVLSVTLFAQNILNPNEVARINDITISTDEFLERYEMSPHFNQNIKKISPSIKLQFLYNLITEKLWATEAVKIGLDTTEAIMTSVSSIEKIFVRHSLFELEIRNKIKIPEQKFIKAVIKNSTLYFVKYIFSKDSSDVNNNYESLIAGVPFSNLLSKRKESLEQNETKQIYFGDLIETIEEPLFQLNIGEFTEPLEADDGWYIFYVYDKSELYFNTKEEEENANKYVRKILRNRIGEKIQNRYIRDFFSDKKIDVNRKLFLLLSIEMKKIFSDKNKYRLKNSGTLLSLDVYDILKLRKELKNRNLTKYFIEFDNTPVTLNEFLNNLIFDGFQIEEPSQVTAYLNARVRKFIEQELLAREGLKRNLQELPEVKKYVNIWKHYYLAQSFLSNQIEKESINDEDIKKYYDDKFKTVTYQEQVNVIEVLVDSLKLAKQIYKKAIDGINFSTLASEYSTRVWTKENKGEFGLFPISMMGPIGKRAAKMEVGDISNPIKVKQGYSIIKLIDKQKEKVEPPSKSFQQVKNSLKREMAYANQVEHLTNTTAQFANSSFIKINPITLNNIQVTNLNSFSIRVMGFGGKITSVPIIKPFTEWVNKWITKPDILP